MGRDFACDLLSFFPCQADKLDRPGRADVGDVKRRTRVFREHDIPGDDHFLGKSRYSGEAKL